MTAPAIPLSPFTAEVIAEWREYESRNRRATMDYHRRVTFREVRRDTERHLYAVPVAS